EWRQRRAGVGQQAAEACTAVRGARARGLEIGPRVTSPYDDRASAALREEAADGGAEIARARCPIACRQGPRPPVEERGERFPALDGDRQIVERTQLRGAAAPRPVH